MRSIVPLILLLIFAAAGTFAVVHWPEPTPRFSMIKDELGIVYQIDHETGRTWRFQGTEKIEVKVEDAWEKLIVPADLHEEVVLKLSVHREPATPFYRLKGHIFNGTDWNLTEMTLLLTVHPKQGEPWSREVRSDIYVRVHSTGVVPIETLEADLPESFGAQIVQLRGYPPWVIADRQQYAAAQEELAGYQDQLSHIDPAVPLQENGIERAMIRDKIAELQQRLAIYEGRQDTEWLERTGLKR